MIIFTLLFSKLITVPSDGIPYPVFLFRTHTMDIHINLFICWGRKPDYEFPASDKDLFSTVYFTRTPCIAAFMDYCISLLVLIPLFLYYGIIPSSKILLLPIVLAVSFLLVCGAGCIFASIAVKYRDVHIPVTGSHPVFNVFIASYLSNICHSGTSDVVVFPKPAGGSFNRS